MARPLRIEFAGTLYHITVRGNERHDIFFEEVDRTMFLSTTLGNVCKRRKYRRSKKWPLANELSYYADKYVEQERAMMEAYRSGAYIMREIGDFFGVSRMTELAG